MKEEFDFKEWFVRFFTSIKGLITVCVIFAITFYVFAYVMNKPDYAESEKIYNTLRDIAYAEAEEKNTDYEINDVLLKYEVSTMEEGFRHVTLVGKDNVNLKFYLSADYEIIETLPSWKVSTTTTIIVQILSSILIGFFGGIVVYFSLLGFDLLIDKFIHKKIKN